MQEEKVLQNVLSSSDISCDDELDFADRQDRLWDRETQNETTI